MVPPDSHTVRSGCLHHLAWVCFPINGPMSLSDIKSTLHNELRRIYRHRLCDNRPDRRSVSRISDHQGLITGA